MDYLPHLYDFGVLPLSTERPCQEPSKAELRRWLDKRSVRINGKKPLPEEIVDLPITDLCFFEKGARKTTML